MQDTRWVWKRVDWILFAGLLMILGIGIAFIYSATYHSGGITSAKNSHVKQLMWTGISLGLFWGMLKVPYLKIVRASFSIYLVALVVLASVLVFGVEVNGSMRWLRIAGVTVQPSEMMKLVYILAAAQFLSQPGVSRSFVGVLGGIGLMVPPVLLILKQPDLGTALVFFPVCAVLLVVSGVRWKHLAILAAGGILMVPILWSGLKDYQRQRVLSFVGLAWEDHPLAAKLFDKYNFNVPQSRERSAYQQIQSEIAVGSGGLAGKGYMEGTQNQMSVLPQSANDFIFAVIAEEWGFLGCLFLLMLYLLLIFGFFRIADDVVEPAGKLLAVGVATLFGVQILVNTGMVTGLLPVTGITLPLVSYGGSSFVTFFLSAGLVLNVAIHQYPSLAPREGPFS